MNQQELKELRQAQSQGMSLEDFKKAKENKAYKDEVKAIEDSEAQAEAEADAGAEETAATDAEFAERPWVTREERKITAGGDPYDDPNFGQIQKDDWAQAIYDRAGEGDRYRKNREKQQSVFDVGRFAHGSGKKITGYEEMYPESYKDSVRREENTGISRERDIYTDSPLHSMQKMQEELKRKVANQEMTLAEADEAFENHRLGLFHKINLEKAGAFTGEFQGVGVMPPQEQPPKVAPPQETTLESQRMDSEALDDWHQEQEGGGFMPESPDSVAPVPPETKEALSPESEEMHDLQEKAITNKDAEKERKEMMKQLSPEERALAKEELGDYYIGPGGYAINIKKVNAGKSYERLARFSLLQNIPDHAKPQMLASWGYLDQEDVDDMPEHPDIEKEKLKVAGELSLRDLINKGIVEVANINNAGSLKRTQVQTRSAEQIAQGQYRNNTDLATMNNAMKEKITRMNLDWEEIKQESVEIMHMNDLELDEWKTRKGYDIKKEELQDLRNHFNKEMTFKYKQLGNKKLFQDAQLAQQGAEFLANFGLKSTEQQQGWFVKQHTMMMQKAKELMDSGQPEAAMMVFKQAGTDIDINIPGYWRAKAKTAAFENSAVTKAYGSLGYSTANGNLNTGINKFLDEKIRLRKMYSDPKQNDDMDTALDIWVRQNKDNRNFSKSPLGPAWADMNEQEKGAYPGGYPAWKAEMTSKAINYDLTQGEFGDIQKAMLAQEIEGKITPKTKRKKTQEPSPKEDVAGETTLDEITDEQAEKKKFTDNINKTFAAELQRGDEEYQTKFASFFRSPSSKSEALKVGKKDLGFGMRKYLRGLAKDHGIRSAADIDELIKQPKKLTEFFRNNMKWFKKLSPEAKFYVAQQDSNVREGLIK